ncbi:unknown [Roseburia sp. CAG:309]|nr:unknown [Roseburia sp. CAG:309]
MFLPRNKNPAFLGLCLNLGNFAFEGLDLSGRDFRSCCRLCRRCRCLIHICGNCICTHFAVVFLLLGYRNNFVIILACIFLLTCVTTLFDICYQFIFAVRLFRTVNIIGLCSTHTLPGNADTFLFNVFTADKGGSRQLIFVHSRNCRRVRSLCRFHDTLDCNRFCCNTSGIVLQFEYIRSVLSHFVCFSGVRFSVYTDFLYSGNSTGGFYAKCCFFNRACRNTCNRKDWLCRILLHRYLRRYLFAKDIFSIYGNVIYTVRKIRDTKYRLLCCLLFSIDNITDFFQCRRTLLYGSYDGSIFLIGKCAFRKVWRKMNHSGSFFNHCTV